MIHSDCETHHCKDEPKPRCEAGSSNTIKIKGHDPAGPEFLHCGFWPAPQTSDYEDDGQDPCRTGRTRTRTCSPEDFSNMVDSWIIDTDDIGLPALVGPEAGVDHKGQF